MSSKQKKRYIISLFVVALGLITAITSTSYALLKGQTMSSEEQVIKTGSVELSLVENFESVDLGLSPSSDTKALMNDNVYEFSISNIGDIKAKYTVFLENKPDSSYTGKSISDDYIKVSLEVNGEKKGPYRLSDVKNIIDNNIIYKNEIINYKMRIWLDDSKNSYNTTDKAFLKLRVKAEQSS